MEIDYYLALVDNNVQQMVLPVIEYIQDHYSNALFDDNYSTKPKLPMWKLDDKYVAIGCRKHYISIYFSSHKAVQVVSDNTSFVRAHKGCVNFSYKRELPYSAIFKGIDFCFSNNSTKEL